MCVFTLKIWVPPPPLCGERESDSIIREKKKDKMDKKREGKCDRKR
jgi:hypothetical protein